MLPRTLHIPHHLCQTVQQLPLLRSFESYQQLRGKTSSPSLFTSTLLIFHPFILNICLL